MYIYMCVCVCVCNTKKVYKSVLIIIYTITYYMFRPTMRSSLRRNIKRRNTLKVKLMKCRK